MYDVQRIQDEFMGLVGLRQTDNPAFDRISADIVKTSTNVLIQHPLLNIENLDMCARNYNEYTFDAWDSGEEYEIGDRVKESNIVYESIQDGNTNHAITDTDWWSPVSLLSLYLEDVFRNGIDDVVNKVVNLKKLRREAKQLLDNVILFEGAGSKNDLIVNDGSLVGFSFRLKYSRNLEAFIKRIGHQFSGTGTFEAWVYHSSQVDEPIATITINHTKAGSFQWTADIQKLKHIDESYDAGGIFFYMYDQNLIPGQAVNKTRKNGWGNRPCGTCSGFDLKMWNLYSKYMEVQAVKVTAANRVLAEGSDDSAPDMLWDINQTQSVDTNWGLNFEFMMRCDLTELLIQHKDTFALALRDTITVKLLENLSNSTRQNVGETKVAPKALIALQNGSVGGGDIRAEAERQIKAVDFEFSGFNDFCLPCNNAKGLNYGAAGVLR
jgi:hypothetical protein